MVMHMTSCCCGCSLKTGTVIIGVLSMIGSLVGIINAVLFLTGETNKDEDLNHRNLNMVFPHLKTEEETTTTAHLDVIVSPATMIVYLIVDAIYLLLTILLLVGVGTKRPRLIKPWIVFSVMSAIAQTILYLVAIIYTFMYAAAYLAVLIIVFAGVGIAIGVYFMLIVNSYHTELLSFKNNFQPIQYKI